MAMPVPSGKLILWFFDIASMCSYPATMRQPCLAHAKNANALVPRSSCSGAAHGMTMPVGNGKWFCGITGALGQK